MTSNLTWDYPDYSMRKAQILGSYFGTIAAMATTLPIRFACLRPDSGI